MWTRETTYGPSERTTVQAHKGVFLFETEPGNFILCLVHDLLASRTVVCLVGGSIVVVGLSHDENVVTATEGVLEYPGWTQVDIGIMTVGLVGRRAVEIPLTEAADVGDFAINGLKQTQ